MDKDSEDIKQRGEDNSFRRFHDDFHFRISKHLINMLKGDLTDNLQNRETREKQKIMKRKACMLFGSVLGALALG